MTREEAEQILQAVVASSTFNSREGRGLQRQGVTALRDLPAGLDPQLVRASYARYLDEAPYEIWRLVPRARLEHARALLDELRGRPLMQGHFLLHASAAPETGITREAFRRLIQAGRTLAKIYTYAHAPLTHKAAERIRPYGADPAVLAAARATVQSWSASLALSELLVYLWLLVILAQDGAPESLAALRVAATHARGRSGASRDAETMTRLLGLYVHEHSGLQAIVRLLSQP